MLRFERVFHDVKSSKLILDGDEARLVHDTTGSLPLPRHAAEFGMAWVVMLARRTTGEAIIPRDVLFAHPAPGPIDEHRRLFGIEPRFGAAANAVHLRVEDLARPHRAADPALADVLASHARHLLERLPDSSDLTAQVRRAIHDGLTAGDAALATIARALELSPRTLQRQLRGEGQSFRALLDEVRRELAPRYLRESRFSVAEVAFALGFADQTAFHRAFVRWTGEPPGAFRRGNKQVARRT
jgi:AraC-like DNA-binding protein